MIWIFFTTWSMVLSAEIVGDKSLYTIGSLATRYWALPIFLGSAVAFMIKMLVAVLFASLLSRLPEWLVISLNAATFSSIAFILWFKHGEPIRKIIKTISFPEYPPLSDFSVIHPDGGFIINLSRLIYGFSFET
jgi:hypothetical protein